MSFLAEIESTTNEAAADQARQKHAAHEAEVAHLKEREAHELGRYSLESLKADILKAATEAKSHVSISVFSYEDQTPPWWEPVKNKLIALASTLEVKVEFEISALSSSGSDPLFDHTTYYGRAYLSW